VHARERNGPRHFVADLVAVPGDPLQDIRQTEKVTFVMQGGRIVRNQAAAR
jgi:imidazolonepropionase-like amidohydrolase